MTTLPSTTPTVTDSEREDALLGLWGRDEDARNRARDLDEEDGADRYEAAHEMAAVNRAWRVPITGGRHPGYDDGPDEDDAEVWGIAVLACYVLAVESAVADAARKLADNPPGPCMAWGSSSWSNEAFPRAALGL